MKHIQISVRGGAAAAVMLACWHYAPTLTHIHTKHFLSQRRWWSSTAIPATATATTAASPAFKYTTAAAVLLLLDSWPAQQQQGQPAVVAAGSSFGLSLHCIAMLTLQPTMLKSWLFNMLVINCPTGNVSLLAVARNVDWKEVKIICYWSLLI